MPDTLDEDGDDALDGDETERLVFIEVGVRVETGAPKQAWSQRTCSKESAVGQRDDRRPPTPVAAET